MGSMERLPQNGEVFNEDGSWKPDAHINLIHPTDRENEAIHVPQLVGFADTLEAEMYDGVQTAGRMNESNLEADGRGSCATMMFVDFVGSRFVPQHVLLKRTSGRTHYQAILKHVLTPEEVDRVFKVDTAASQGKLKTKPAWPYISTVKLRDIQPAHVQLLISAALEGGYSTQTATHVRNVVSAVFTYATKEGYFAGANPASQVILPGMKRKEKHALSLGQVKQVLEIMQYPEKEMTLIAILTSMNVAEICGLQWKHVNLTSMSLNREGEVIAAKTIAVRKQWYRGELCAVTNGRRKDIGIPEVLFPVLQKLSSRTRCIGTDDFVLMSNAGTPINQMNVAARRLKSIGRDLHMPWLSWQVFRRTHTSLLCEFGMQFLRQMTMIVRSDFVGTPTSMRTNTPSLKLLNPQHRPLQKLD
jgi:integrase